MSLETTFAETVNTAVEYHVFLTPKGDCEGLYVANETPQGFEVRELHGGHSDVSFDYRIIARQIRLSRFRPGIKQVPERDASPGTLIITVVLFGSVFGGVWYFTTPHPHPRSIVRLRNEDIVTVDGVTNDGWLTECETGNHRHVVGDFSVISDSTPAVVCVGERNYDDWLKQTRAASK